MQLYHGSPELFSAFDLSKAGESTGVKFGFGVYLTESEASAVHYSQPRNMEQMVPNHYLYTLVQTKLGIEAPVKVLQEGKEFRKWVGMTLLGTKKSAFAEEKAAAELLNSLGVLYNVWPQAQTKPDGLKNIAVFDAANVKIVKVEQIEVELKCKKYVLAGRKNV